jgi:hypothetical protein
MPGPLSAPCPPCSHPEAFCLMWYGTGVSRVRIWNSRDGVTPFYMNGESKHEDWRLDECVPWHVPKIGDLVFVDLTLERATEGRRRYVDRFWREALGPVGSRMIDRYASKEEAIALLAKADFEGPGAPEQVGGVPDLVTVVGDWQIVALCENARRQARELGLISRELGLVSSNRRYRTRFA